MVVNELCENCSFWLCIDNGRGECNNNLLALVEDIYEEHTDWDDWCPMWAEKEEE